LAYSSGLKTGGLVKDFLFLAIDTFKILKVGLRLSSLNKVKPQSHPVYFGNTAVTKNKRHPVGENIEAPNATGCSRSRYE